MEVKYRLEKLNEVQFAYDESRRKDLEGKGFKVVEDTAVAEQIPAEAEKPAEVERAGTISEGEERSETEGAETISEGEEKPEAVGGTVEKTKNGRKTARKAEDVRGGDKDA